jgi:hypothetical protein
MCCLAWVTGAPAPFFFSAIIFLEAEAKAWPKTNEEASVGRSKHFPSTVEQILR